MKNAIGLLLLGLLLRYGAADVSHLAQSGRSPYLPPPIQNLPIEQDYNGLDSQSRNGGGFLQPPNVGDRGYLPPYQGRQGNSYNEQKNNPQRHFDDSLHNDHVDIDHEQLEPVRSTNLPPQSHNHVNQVARGESHSIAFGHPNPTSERSPTPLTPVPSTNQEEFPPIHDGYQYLPPANQAPESLYPNRIAEHSNNGGRNVPDYLPPRQSNLDHSHQHQDYLPPAQPTQRNHEVSNHNLGHSNQQPNGDYLPPNPLSLDNSGHRHQEPNQDYLPPANANRISQSNQVQQDYLPPRNINQQQGYLPPKQSTQAHLDSPQLLHQRDYLPPTQSSELPISSGGLHIVPPPQLRLPQQQPASQLTVRGHVNVPLPIPQVGYFFVPGVVSTIPSLAQQKSLGLRPAVNIPAIINAQQAALGPTQRISSPEFSRTFLLQNQHQAAALTNSGISLAPSVQTLHSVANQNYLPPNQFFNGALLQHQNALQIAQNNQIAAILQHNIQTLNRNLLGYLPPQRNNLQVSYPQQLLLGNVGQGYLPPLNQIQQQVNYQQQQNLNQINNAGNEYIPPNALPNQGLHLQNIARSEVQSQQNQISPNNYQGTGYLPPVNDLRLNQPQLQELRDSVNNGRGYLPPPQPANYNHVTSLQTYMSGVHPNDRYGSSQYQQPPPNVKGNPPPPVVTAPPMFSKSSAIQAYAPGMAYRASTNTPYNTLTPDSYLAPVENAPPQENNNDQSGQQLNEDAKRNLNQLMPKDNTVFPLEDLLDLQDNDIDLPQLMEQLRGRIRTVQIVNNHANSVKNIKVLETSDSSGVKTIKILGHSDEDPMGEHKIVRIVSKGPHPDGIVQTVKIFSDHKEVSLPTQNAYVPPPKAKENYSRVSRHSQEGHRSH